MSDRNGNGHLAADDQTCKDVRIPWRDHEQSDGDGVAAKKWIVAERAVIGTLIADAEAAKLIIRHLDRNQFGRDHHRVIFGAAEDLFEEGHAVNAEAIWRAADGAVSLDEIKAISEAAAENWLELVDIIKAESLRRQVRAKAIAFVKNLRGADVDAAEVLAEMQASLAEITTAIPRDRYHSIEAPALLGKVFPETRWTAEGLIPEGLTVLAGAPKLGKSWWVLQLALSVPNGVEFLKKFLCDRGEVLFLALEDTEKRIQGRIKKVLRRWQCDTRGLHIQNDAPGLGEGLEAYLRTWLREHPKIRCVIIDTFQKIRRMAKPKELSDYGWDYQSAAKLKAIADEFHIAVILVHHTRKMADVDAFNTIHGSQGLTGAADALLVLKRDRGRSDAVLHVTGRDIEEQELAMAWDKDSATWTALGDAGEYRRSVDEVAVLELLERENRAVKPKEASEIIDKSHEACKKLMRRMSDRGLIKSDGKGAYVSVSAVDHSSISSVPPVSLFPAVSSVPAVPGDIEGQRDKGFEQSPDLSLPECLLPERVKAKSDTEGQKGQ